MAGEVKARDWFAREGMWYVWYDPSTYVEVCRVQCFPDGNGRFVATLDRTASGRVAVVPFRDQPLTTLIANTDKVFHLCAGDTFYMTLEGLPG